MIFNKVTTRNKFRYYIKAYSSLIVPNFFWKKKIKHLEAAYQKDIVYIQNRVDYYNKAQSHVDLSDDKKIQVSYFKKNMNKFKTTYFFDTMRIVCFFKQHLFIAVTFGDINTYLPEISFVKSRPIAGKNENSVLLKLNSIRHFIFVKKDKPFIDKKDKLVGRMDAHQPQRVSFILKFLDHPMCNVGNVNPKRKPFSILKDKLSIKQHLDYKFISCIEGRDVASNLKWVMSSNSIAVMPKPKFETWFMEGTLIPNYHYIEIKDDFSDLETKLNYYINHPQKAMQIIENAHKYVNQFKDSKRELYIGFLVMKKFFKITKQLSL